MKLRLLSLLLLAALSLNALAQNDEASFLKYGTDRETCDQNLSIYTEFYKQKNYVTGGHEEPPGTSK